MTFIIVGQATLYFPNIAKLENKLTPAELLARRQCFEKAYEFVGSVPSGGISAFFKHSHGAILVAQEQIQK